LDATLCCDSSGRNALLKTFCDEFWEDVELQHTAAAMQAWGCVDDTAHHACTALEYVTYVELQQAAAAVQACDCIATRGYATRVRVRHVDNRVRVRGHHSCTALEYVTYVELQQAATTVQACDYIATRGYATRVRVRHVDNRVRVRGHHSCTGSPRAHATLDATISTV
jgi:mRNA-degrading endonuclease toxin of MazEF toxin-antitoxin module